MKTEHFTCDCGCNKTTTTNTGWLQLSQPTEPTSHSDPKIRTLDFSSFECLTSWLTRANEAISRLQKETRSWGGVRGVISDKNVAGLYF